MAGSERLLSPDWFPRATSVLVGPRIAGTKEKKGNVEKGEYTGERSHVSERTGRV